MDADPEYCPFCGARLSDPATGDGADYGGEQDPLLLHLQDNDTCSERYEAWNPGRTTVELAGNRRQSPLGRILMWTIIGLVVGYSLLVVQKPLIGVAVGLLVYLAFNVEIDR